MRVLILLLLCASAFSSGVMVLGNGVKSVDLFTCLKQTYPDFAVIAMDLQTQDWTSFQQTYQNALDAGYHYVHVLIASWQPLQNGSLPSSFSGRVWITGVPKTYGDLVTMAQDITLQGYEVGIWGDMYWTYYLTGVTPSFLSSLPFALETSVDFPWQPFAGWQCPIIMTGDSVFECPRELITPLLNNPNCI